MKLPQGVSMILTEGLFYKKTWFKRPRRKNLENRKSGLVYVLTAFLEDAIWWVIAIWLKISCEHAPVLIEFFSLQADNQYSAASHPSSSNTTQVLKEFNIICMSTFPISTCWMIDQPFFQVHRPLEESSLDGLFTWHHNLLHRNGLALISKR